MGHKRKASAMEDLSTLPDVFQPSSPPSMTTDSTQSSPSSMNTEPYHQPSYQPTLFKSASSSWLNSRTLKRHRDNRPSEETIHNQTVQKLFEAQKDPEAGQTIVVDLEEMDEDTDMTEDGGAKELSELPTILEPEPNQRSLHDFFRIQTLSTPQVVSHGDIQGSTEDVGMGTLLNTPQGPMDQEITQAVCGP